MTEAQNSRTPASLKAAVEALLFMYGEPLEFKRIAETADATPEAVRAALAALQEEYAAEGRGLSLVMTEHAAQLVTKPVLAPLVESFIKEDFARELTVASLETLAIVLYAAPVARAEIEYIRGVNSTFMLHSLLLRGLITRHPDPKRANTYLYEPSFDLLRHLGISSRGELPDATRYRELLEAFRNPPASTDLPVDDMPTQGKPAQEIAI